MRLQSVTSLGLLVFLVAGCGPGGGGENGNNANLNNENSNLNTNGNTNGNDNSNGNGSLPVRECVFSIGLEHATASSVTVAGSFNGWDAVGWPLSQNGSHWELRFTTDPGNTSGARLIDPGEHQYKLVVDSTEWWLDPSNPLTRFDDEQTNENSLLIAPDCRPPLLELTNVTVRYDQQEIVLDVQVRDGVEGSGLQTVDASQNGQLLDAGEVVADLTTGVVQINMAGLPSDKYTFEVGALDNGGRRSTLRVPVWMELEPRTWEDLTLYNIMVDRFHNGDSTNDAPAGVDYAIDWHGGDWAGITQKLQEGFFTELGVSALWISTPHDNPDTAQPGDCGQNFSGYHSYWAQSAREVENHFGTADELKELVGEAHRQGIRVMIDWAANHIFVDHPLYQAHAGDWRWFNYPATTDPSQLWQNKCGVLPDGWNTYALECWFTEYLPDYNHRNHELVRLLTEDALWWIKEFDLDGFRVDATKHIRSTYLRYLRHRLDREVATWYTPFYMVGENFIYDYALIADKISAHELQGQFDFPLYGSVRWAFGDATTHFADLNTFVYQSFIDNHAIPDLDWGAQGRAANNTLVGIFLGNHDVTRFSSMVAGQEDPGNVLCQAFAGSPPQPTDEYIYRRMQLAFTFLLTVRGLPVIYYGDEIGLAGVHDPDNRRDMEFDLAGLQPAQQELRATVARLGQLRRSHSALRTGRYAAFWGDDSCFAYAKVDANETLLVVLSGDQGCTVELPIQAGFGLADGDVLVDALPESGGQVYPISGATISLDLPAWTSQVLVKQ
ncbi:MAG: alpha-amylase family glycosyl hydrolase [bacterium]